MKQCRDIDFHSAWHYLELFPQKLDFNNLRIKWGALLLHFFHCIVFNAILFKQKLQYLI